MLSKLKYDLPASLVVFIIAIPLSLGIALASGAPMGAGIVAAVVGGIIVGLFTGAPVVVTGPAAGLTALCFQYVNSIGYLGLCIATVIAGFIQVGFASVRLGRFFEKIPQAIIVGMLMAIGITIIIGQFHILLGAASVPKSIIDSILEIPELMTNALSQPHLLSSAAVFGLTALAFQILWSRSSRLSKILPGALPAVVFVTIIALPYSMPRVDLAPLFETASQGAAGILGFSEWPVFPSILAAGFGLAAVASAETLLTIRAAGEMELCKDQKRCNLNRELMVQGFGNSVSGFFGGLPMTGVMVRTAANINAGAKTRWSAILHAVWIVGFMALIPNVMKSIPLTALASVLILTGVKLININQLKQLYASQKPSFYGALLCCIAIIGTDLLTGLIASTLTYIGYQMFPKLKESTSYSEIATVESTEEPK